MNICVYGAASSLIDENYMEKGKDLGREMARRGHGLVFGGGANGMMGSVARGAQEEGGYILGVVPEFFKEGGEEVSFNNCSEYIFTETMRERKRFLEEKSDAFIISPGGIGTLDEFFEILTLKQLGRHNKAIAIYDINNFYGELDVWIEKAIREKFITDDLKELYRVFNSRDEMLDYLENYDPTDIDVSKVKIR